jgi:small-conductance mechanosensitive channel
MNDMSSLDKNPNNPLKEQSDIQEVLDEMEGSYKRKKKHIHAVSSAKEKFYVLVYLISLVALATLHFAFHLEKLEIPKKYAYYIPHLITGGISVVLILLLSTLFKIYYINEIKDRATQFNLTRLLHFVSRSILFFIFLSVFYANWYTAVVSLGLLSIVLGFALQTPILSFIGWIYILVRRPYKVGDRIKVGEDMGDVVDIGYLDTTMWEIKGANLSSNHPSGSIIRFPNSNILNAAVFNYSWALFPFVFHEIIFYIAYETDLNYISSVMKKIAEEELGAEQSKEINKYKALLAQAHIDEENIKDKPEVTFKPSDNMWMQAILMFPVLPENEREVKIRLTRKIFAELNKKDNVLFPSGNGR